MDVKPASSHTAAFGARFMEGHWDADGTQMIAAIRKATGNPDIKVRRSPWLLMRLLSPFVPLFHELSEMRYLWIIPVRMGNERLKEVLGAEPHTPLDLAVHETLIGIGCMPKRFRNPLTFEPGSATGF